MIYTGRLQISAASFSNWVIRSLSQHESVGEIALIEYDQFRCDVAQYVGPCYHHLALYEDDFLNRQA